MLERRRFLQSILAASLLPARTWADVGNPSYLAAGRQGDGRFVLAGLDLAGQMRFTIPLPTRGHAAAAHPSRPVAVAFARRPGVYAIVLECVNGRQIARMDAPEGRHFYGHGVFSQDGNTLFTTENAYETGAGMIGIWDVTNGYRRIGEFPSNGIGPHEVLRLPGTDILVVANGGIRTHPETGRAKLNLDTMRPNLSYIAPNGAVLDVVTLAQHQSSIRHIAVRPDGLLGMAMQWQGRMTDVPPLLATHRMHSPARLMAAPPAQHRWLKGYGGSVAFSQDATRIGITSPRGGIAQFFDLETGTLHAEIKAPDICGLAPHPGGFLATDGHGNVIRISPQAATRIHPHTAISWDNHLVSIG